MCGILGIVADRASPPEMLRDRIRQMGVWQTHRGPDGWGEWVRDGVALGHNRLAIIDLPGGHQPMGTEDGEIQTVFNGEIYNCVDLRRRLEQYGHRFRTDHSDTEVIVHGYRQWGVEVFRHLEGMFAIGIWDGYHGRMVLARDRVGIKPLYYSMGPDGLVFASEPKTILASRMVGSELRVGSIPDYFMFRAPVQPHTMLGAIRKLEPGTYRVFDLESGLGDAVPYWTLAAEERKGMTPGEWEERILKELDRAVKSHLLADVPVGLFLSGGVDSSLIAALSSRHSTLQAFTVGTRSSLDESGYARTVAEHLGLRVNVREVTAQDYLERFDDWMYFNDDPVADPSALALLLLAEHAREHGMKVMLSGEGADELAGGYHSYQRYAAFLALRRVPFASGLAARLGPRVGGRSGDYLTTLPHLQFLGTAHVLDAAAREMLFTGELHRYEDSWALEGHAPPTAGALRQAMLFDQAVRLPNDILPRTDRATMAVSLEARVPFLDRRVIELLNGLPDPLAVRLVRPECKWVLKRIAARQVPAEVVYRRKLGFELPVHLWLGVEFRERMEDYLREAVVPGLDYSYLKGAYRLHRDGKHGGTAMLWAQLVLEEWYRRWVLGQATPRASSSSKVPALHASHTR